MAEHHELDKCRREGSVSAYTRFLALKKAMEAKGVKTNQFRRTKYDYQSDRIN